MKLYVVVFLLFIGFSGCRKNEIKQIYMARNLTENEDFNTFEKGNDQLLKTTLNEEGDTYIKFRDTLVSIRSGISAHAVVWDRFTFAAFLNSQKTSLLVQVADQSGLTAPVFILAVRNGKLDVAHAFRPSEGKGDKRFTKGIKALGRSAYLINNDFVITRVNAKVYSLTRQHKEERIQGLYFINSADKKTLVFLVSSSLYQVHYPTGRVFTQQLSSSMPNVPADLFNWIQQNYSWETDAQGIAFLKQNKK